ncbi:hypothetical protein FCL47_12940 [Desulfopila sp. IMCC35006]|uniref:phage tail tip lysozyme n=1 Tax=Desulfopila sp. IMCC35006 TaxID=2569542 RepID=UPI0010AB5A83|nr:phage tail tip lysozyme [Desulfopila sp. IMCC35006]TKB25985.1 hypothetical protein FCL47_12940 [Desulfopila sp. IMCC35006]
MKAPAGVSSQDQRLGNIMKSQKSLFAASMKKMLSNQESTEKIQSEAFKSFSKTIKDIGKSVGKNNSAKDAKANSKAITVLKREIENTNSVTIEEKKSLINLTKQVQAANISVRKSQVSMVKTIGKSFKDNLPSIGTVIDSVGLGNPVFDLIGNTLKGVLDQRIELASNDAKNSKMVEENVNKTSELVDLENGTNSILSDHSAKLDYIGSLLDVMVSGGESAKFAKIESDRERIRREESLIDAVENINVKGNEGLNLKNEKGGFFSGLGDNLLQAIIGGGAVTGITTALTTALGVVIPAALIGVAAIGTYQIYNQVSDGWKNAADKLGKETATTADEWASSLGSFFGGGIARILDDVSGLFGIKTEIQSTIDKTSTKLLADTFDFFKDFQNNIKGMYNAVINWFKEKFNSAISFLIGDSTGSERLKSLKDTLNNKVNDIKNAASSIADMPEKRAGNGKYGKFKYGSNDQKIISEMNKLGYNEDEKAAILANIHAESNGGNPKAVGDNGSAFGLLQWRGSRQVDFKKLFGHPIQDSSIEEQLQFAKWESHNTEKSAGDKFRAAKGKGAKAAAWSTNFERPHDVLGEASRRAAAAEKIIITPSMDDRLSQMHPSNRLLENQFKADSLHRAGVEKEKSMRGGVGAIVSAPKSTKINQTTNNTSAYVGASNLRNQDPSIIMMNNMVSY